MNHATCPRCNLEGHQIYTVEGELGKYIFDVGRARRIANDGNHRAYEVPVEMLEMLLLVNEEHVPEHIDHVDARKPGILAQRWGGIALIDGNHRARRALRDKVPFYCFMLDLRESFDVLMFQEQANLTPELIARELRGMLKNNPQCESMSVAFTSDESAVASEEVVRSFLTPEENARIEIRVEEQKPPPSTFTCPICQMTSYNENDVRFGYCGNCHQYTRERIS